MAGFTFRIKQPKIASPSTDSIISKEAWANRVKTMQQRVEKRISTSHVINRKWIEKDEAMAFLDKEELVLGELLGSGTFANVHEVIGFKPHENTNRIIEDCTSKYTERQMQSRYSFFSHSVNNGEMARYAIKHLKTNTTMLQSDLRFSRAASDLLMEAAYLSVLDHENIIKIHGLSATGIESYQLGGDGFFLVMDRLHETLGQRIERWTLEQQHNSFLNRGLSLIRFGKHCHTQYKQAWTLCRTQIARQVAAALEYLHSRNIVFRDLKPDNVGFDAYGTVKLFDFGIAREIPESTTRGTFKMSGKAGSIRYMAPEVALCEEYNLTVDTYSWSLLYWTCLTLEKPYIDMVDRSMHLLTVCRESRRPSLRGIPNDIRQLLQKSWTKSIKERLSMTEVCIQLDSIIENLLFSATLSASRCATAQRVETPEVNLVMDFPLPIV